MNTIDFQPSGLPMLINVRSALHIKYSVNKYGWNKWVFDQLQIKEGQSIIELGAGDGALWRENRDKIPMGTEIMLTDILKDCLLRIEMQMQQTNSNITYAIMDAQSLPLDPARFDIVVANFMLYLLPDRNRAIKEVKRILKPGGSLFAATYGKNHLSELIALVEEFKLQDIFSINNLPNKVFGLEHGKELYEIGNVETKHYEDCLKVPNVKPILQYLYSYLNDNKSLLMEEREKLSNLVAKIEEQIDQDGYYKITKDIGIHIAHKE